MPVCLGLLMIGGCWLRGVPAGLAASQGTLPSLPAFSGGTMIFSSLFAGQRPDNLGIEEGQLPPCPSTPNCVSSQSEDAKHRVEPLSYQSDPAAAFDHLKQIVRGMDHSRIVSESDNYLYAEFTSAILGFVDDVEFYLDQADQVIHVRSASRLGQSDLGVNRKRVEAIRTQFNG